MSDTLFFFDGYGLIYRAYFALINRPLTDPDGKNVSGVHGFFRTLLALRDSHEAHNVLVAMDPKGPTFRHERYPAYKATRDSAPEDLHAQVPLIEEVLECLRIPVVRMDRFEADDIIGSAAEICRRQGRACRLVSADKDLMQLVDDQVRMVRPEKGGGFREIGPDDVLAEKKVRPDQIVDYLALIGDKSDNIPGVAGIGEKSAAALLAEWDNLDNLYAHLELAAKGARLGKLREGKEAAYFSRELVTIRRDLDLGDRLNLVENGGGDPLAAAELLRERGMRVLADDIASLADGGREDGKVRESRQQTLNGHYTAILTEEDLELWEKKIRRAGMVALDTETDNLDPMRAKLVGFSVAVEPHEAAYLPICRPDGPTLPPDLVFSRLNDLFGDGGVRIIGQNFKYDMKVLRRAGVNVGAAWFDTMIAAWVLDASRPVGMDALAGRLLNLRTQPFSEVVSKGQTFSDVPLDKAVNYAAEDADVTLQLYRVLSKKLEEDEGRLNIFWKMEMPLQPILASMEMRGIGLDVTALESYGAQIDGCVGTLTQEIYALCGREFNIASPKQLQQVLFEERGLRPGKKTKTGFSTDNSVLSDLAGEDPVPEKILLYRSLTKIKSTYVDILPKLVHPDDGRVHTSYSQTGAITGRLSSNNPNLQNIPVRDENGRRIRRAFKSGRGQVFVSADYSQVELVVLAHMSGDEALSHAFLEKVDVHARTAALLYGVDSRDVTAEQRRMAKAVNFGVMYGMSAFRLSNELRISRKEAKHFIETYFATYRRIKEFIDVAVKQAETEGGVRTLYGRFRPLPGIGSRNRVEKAAAERAAVNSRIQGTAADIMKNAMLKVHAVLADKQPEAAILLQVHDELLIESPEREADAVAAMVKETMEAAADLSVPLEAHVEIGPSWGDLH